MQPKEIAIKTAAKFQLWVLAVTLMAIALFLALGLLIGRSIAKPISQLNAAAAQVAEGNLDAGVKVMLKDEIGQLAASFNTMVERLRNSKAELLAAKDYTEQIIKSMDDALIVVGAYDAIQSVNPAACRLLGRTEQNLIGQPITCVGIGGWAIPSATMGTSGSEAGSALLGVIHQAMEGPAKTTIELRRKDQINLAVTAFHVNIGLGKRVTGLLLHDITKEIELARRRDEFVSVASHELRTPLTTILGFTELMLMREVTEETRLKWLETIYKDCQQLTTIIDDLLNISRIHTGKLSFRPEWLPIEQVVEEEMSKIRPTTNRHEFIMEIPPQMPKVWSDKDKLGQVLTNLLSNAVKYSPNGGQIIVSAKHEPKRERVVVSVKDQGIGIAAEDQESLFTSFQRIRRPETENIRGVGLGLYIVKSLIEPMKGEVWVESKLGKGSTFFISVPTRRFDVDGKV